MAEQPGPADGQAKEVVQEIARLPQGNAQVRTAVAGEQPRPRPDVSARQFQVAASLAGPLAIALAVNVSAEAMPLQLWLGDVRRNVIVELAGRFQSVAAAMPAFLQRYVMLHEIRLGRRLGPKHARMLSMLLATAIGRRPLPRGALGCGTLPPLQNRLKLMFQLRQPPPQLGVLRLQFGNPLVTRVVHDPRSVTENEKPRKRNCLTVTIAVNSIIGSEDQAAIYVEKIAGR